MAHVIDQTYGRNRDLGQITDPNLLAYYAGIGYTIDGTSTGPPTTPPNPPAIVVPGVWAPSGASDGDLLTVEHGQIVTAPPAGGGGAVASVAGKTGVVTLVKADVGLGSVDNTADTAKPVSTAQATAIAAKVSLLTPTATKTAAYTAVVGDLAMMNVAGGATTLTLPSAPADKAQVGYRAIGATASVPLVVNRGGSDTIGTTGATSASIPLADEITVLQYDAANTRWLAVSNVKTQASLDARYVPVSDLGAWVASTAYVAGSRYLDPYGFERAVATGYTSGASFGTTDTGNTAVLGVAPRTRRTIAVLSTPTNSVVKNAEIVFRLSVQIPQTTTRWRLRLRNYQVLTETAITTGASFVGVYHGQQAVDSTGQPTAGFVSAPVQALTSFTLPADGLEYISGWITAANNQISPNVPWLLSLAYTGGDTSVGQASGSGQMWYQNTGGSSANVGQQSASGFSTTVATPFDIRIEYETVTTAKIGLCVGDSLTWGTGPSTVPGRSSYPAVYAQRTGNPVTNAGVPSSTAVQWAGTVASLWKYQRLVPTNGYDFATVLIGTNDITASNLSTVQTNVLTVLTSLRTLGIPTIAALTIPPRNWPHARLAAYHAIGATTLIVKEPTLPAGAVQIGEGLTAETVTVSGSGTVSGTASGNDYTYTIGATTKTHVAGEVVASGNEITRLSLNAWLLGVPGPANLAISADRALAAHYDKSMMSPELTQSDLLHLNISGSARVAEALTALASGTAAAY